MILFILLLLMNCLTEYLLHNMLMAMGISEKNHGVYHTVCALLRIAWTFLGTWFAVPMPVFLIVFFALLLLNVRPYPEQRVLMNNFTMNIYLIYTTLLMTVIGCMGLLSADMEYIVHDKALRGLIMNITFWIFNVICFLLLYFHSEILWRKDYDKSKVVIYSRFLFICVIYHLLDAAILTLYPSNRINYLLMVSGDILIFILMYNFLNYNYIFEKSEEIKREYEESEVLIAQQYFEKESLRKLSGVDFLTKTYNRQEICSFMEESIKRGCRLVCVFIDLDGLKQTNDKYGHTFGDIMLKRFADTCIEFMEGQGSLARIGGDEFLLVFLDEEINDVTARIKQLQAKLLEPADCKEKISFSYGISYNEQSVDQYISIADQRMYADKKQKEA